jgi:hypothetical protein
VLAANVRTSAMLHHVGAILGAKGRRAGSPLLVHNAPALGGVYPKNGRARYADLARAAVEAHAFLIAEHHSGSLIVGEYGHQARAAAFDGRDAMQCILPGEHV